MRDFAAANRLLLEQRSELGDALSNTHRVQHFCYFTNQNMAQAADAAFKAAGFDTEMISRTLKSQVIVMHFLRLTLDSLNNACQDVHLIVDHYGGDYAGWDSPIMPSEAISA